MRHFWRSAVLILLILFLCATGVYFSLPSGFSVYSGEALPSGKFYSVSVPAENAWRSVSSATSTGQYTARIKIFGFLPIKSVTVDVISKQKIVPSGQTFGIKLYTEGVIVVGCGNFLYEGKSICPADKAGIHVGDRIIAADGEKINSNEQLSALIEDRSKPIEFTVIRKNSKFKATVTPIIPDGDENYRIGLWVRDSTAGIGTLTYYNQTTGNFAGLGHSVADIDTGEIMPSAAGSIVTADIQNIKKSTDGEAGQLEGSFTDPVLGKLIANTESGVYAKGEVEVSEKAYPIALKGEIKIGDAQIYTQLDDDTPKFYKIQIIKINNNLSENKNMVIKVTDPALLDKTGGIVQGMSGSPILQNGKLIGAVTHVFVSDPTKGYAIFIEKMLLKENSLKMK